MRKFAIFLLVLLGCPIGRIVAQGTIAAQPLLIVTPNALANVEGNSGGGAPFWAITGDPESARFQQVINATEFSAMSGGGWIQQVYIRANSAGPSGTGLSVTYPRLQLNFSTTLRSADNLSTVFSENVGADETVAFSATSFYLATGYGRFDSPQSFGLAFNLQTPFFYDPTKGNLLLEIQNWDMPLFPPGNPVFPGIDGQNQIGDSISSVFGSSVTANQGTALSFGYLFQFGVQPIPEPSTVSLLSMGIIGMGIRWYRSRHRRKSGDG